MLASLLFALHATGGAWGLTEILIAVVVIAAAIGIVTVVLPVMGVQIPAFMVRIFWILVAACVAILAIRFVMSL
jgi:hypothetical protein